MSFAGEIHKMLVCVKLRFIFTEEGKWIFMSFKLAFVCLCYSDQNLLTWTDSAIYIFTPQSGQVLLWTEVKGQKCAAMATTSVFLN